MRQGATQILHGLEGDGCCCCEPLFIALLFVDLFRRLSPGSTTTHLHPMTKNVVFATWSHQMSFLIVPHLRRKNCTTQ